MLIIYQNCKVDLAWLFAPTSEWHQSESSLQAVQRRIVEGLTTMRDIHENDDSKIKEMEYPWRPWSGLKNSPKENEYLEFFDGHAGPTEENNALTAFRFDVEPTWHLKDAFRDAKIWDRVWIMQELSCSHSVRLVAPDCELEWQAVSSFLEDAKYHNCLGTTVGGHEINNVSLSGYVFETAKTLEYQRSIIRGMRDGAESSLMNTLVRFRCTSATDKHDKIYGLLGLVSEPHGIVVDYQKTPQQVFTEATVTLINNAAMLDIICQNYWYTDRENSRMSDLPS